MQKVTKRNIALAIIFLLILVVVALLIGNFTYSFLGADISDDVNTQGETTASGDTLIFSSGNTLSLHATTDNFNATSGNLTDTTNPSVRLIASSRTNNATATYFAGIRIYENTYTYSSGTTAEVILTVRDENGALLEASSDELPYVTVNDVSGFDITGKTGAFNIAIDHPISTTSSTNGTTHTWTFTLTFVNLETDQSINENASIDMEVVLQQDRITIPTFAEICREENSNTLACKVATNYTEDGENGLYYHDGVGTYTNANQEAGDNSYRYAGADPNNYVLFNNELWRIIGVFDSSTHGQSNQKLTKIIRNDSIGSYAWRKSNTNDWGAASLNTILNTYYYNSQNGTGQAACYFYSTTVPGNCDFRVTGLNTTARSMIQSVTWKLGARSDENATTSAFYSAERGTNVYSGRPTTTTGYVGLMYPSDYGYSVLSNSCARTTNLGSYNSSSCGVQSWILKYDNEWTITHSLSFEFSQASVRKGRHPHPAGLPEGIPGPLQRGPRYPGGHGGDGGAHERSADRGAEEKA